ncbi:hypothetical protein ASPTUDRAFT_562641 [Aspergillus tubingensis CBS 134.48]|uniref:Uncharacterized protein n=1 Tax=Aspergillus tubingensis (strain CBS 134.48) TaxID=767770 RepID=A0A1L9N7M1_ASPTC|nr:hypothetical protein ASPTUDRAFT_562641 [Aspergillus tubingensis CBS 134.48]
MFIGVMCVRVYLPSIYPSLSSSAFFFFFFFFFFSFRSVPFTLFGQFFVSLRGVSQSSVAHAYLSRPPSSTPTPLAT